MGARVFRWPLLFSTPFVLATALTFVGLELGLAVLVATVALGLVLLVWERVQPLRTDWRPADGHRAADLLHGVFGFGLGTSVGAWVVGLAVAPFVTVGLWPTSWPVLAQVALALVVFEWGAYWQHRWMHRFPRLFRFHAVHHQPRRLALIKTTRNHAVDLSTATFIALAPLIIWGAPASVLLWVTLVSNTNALLQHANVDLPTPRWLDGWVATPRIHRSHHSLDLVEGNLNFAMNLTVFDRLLSTLRPPPDETPAQVGMPSEDESGTFLRQTFEPFSGPRVEISAPVQPPR